MLSFVKLSDRSTILKSCYCSVTQHVRLFVTAAHQASLSFYHLPELAQTHVHWVGDATQPSHPLLSPSPPAFNLSHHQGLFQWVSSFHQVTKIFVSASVSVLPMNIQDYFLCDWLVWSPCSARDSQESSPTHSSKASVLLQPAFFVFFSFLLTSLSITDSRFIYLTETDSNSFLLRTEWYSVVYMYHIFFIHSSFDGHLGCFHVQPTVNSAAMNIGVCVSFGNPLQYSCLENSMDRGAL